MLEKLSKILNCFICEDEKTAKEYTDLKSWFPINRCIPGGWCLLNKDIKER